MAVRTKSKRGAGAKKKKATVSATSKRTRSRSAKKGGETSGNGRLTGQDLEEFVAKITGLEPGVAREIWRQMLGKIRKSLVAGQAVNMTNVGTLEPYDKQPTTYRHPDTGELETAQGRKHVRFIVSVGLKDDMNPGRRRKAKKKTKKKKKSTKR